jgi:hypothetical protein
MRKVCQQILEAEAALSQVKKIRVLFLIVDLA